MKIPARAAAAACGVSLALAGGALTALPTTAAPASSTASSAAAPALHVDVTLTEDGVRASHRRIRPGNTLFRIESAAGRGTLEVVRFKKGYNLRRLMRDFERMFSGDVAAIRRVNNRTEMYGGMPVRRSGVSEFGARLHRGTYRLVDLDSGTAARLVVAGRAQSRPLPRTEGRIDYVGNDEFRVVRPVDDDGWIRQTNRTREPHFTVIDKVKKRTTAKMVRRALRNPEREPGFILPESREALVLSPGRTMVWRHENTEGKFLLTCWWPDAKDGMPHALMGMWKLFRMR